MVEKKMNVLVACEESQRVCVAFREKATTLFLRYSTFLGGS